MLRFTCAGVLQLLPFPPLLFSLREQRQNKIPPIKWDMASNSPSAEWSEADESSSPGWYSHYFTFLLSFFHSWNEIYIYFNFVLNPCWWDLLVDDPSIWRMSRIWTHFFYQNTRELSLDNEGINKRDKNVWIHLCFTSELQRTLDPLWESLWGDTKSH